MQKTRDSLGGKIPEPALLLKGLRIIATLRCADDSLIREFRHYKAFLDRETGTIGNWSSTAQFYHNFGDTGFAGIECCGQSHISVRSQFGENQIAFDLFLSADLGNYEQSGLGIYNRTITFFASQVAEQKINPSAEYIPLILQKLIV